MMIFFAVALTCVSAQAQQKISIEIVDYGTYTVERVRTNTAGPLRPHDVDNIQHVATTTTVPAELGAEFGMRYRVSGRKEAIVDVTELDLFPPPGLKSPNSTKPLLKYSDRRTRKIGEVNYIGYSFDHAWELVPGTWTFQLWIGSRMMAEQNFTVVAK